MKKGASTIPSKAALMYTLVGYAWIVFSDSALSLFIRDINQITEFQTLKGILFVSITGIIVYWILLLRLKNIEKLTREHYQKEQQLSISEERFYKYFHSNPVSVIIARKRDGVIIDLNRSFQALLGYSPDELAGKTGKDPLIFVTEEEASAFLERVNETPWNREFETTLRTKAGAAISAAAYNEQIEIGGEPCCLLSFLDVTERKHADKEIAKLNRINRMLTNINQLIVRTNEIDNVFKESCTIAVEDGNFKMAWIGLRNDRTNKLDVVVHAGHADNYLTSLNIDFNDTLRSGGPTGRAVTTGKHQYTVDIAKEPTMAPWRDNALRLGFRSSAAFPLTVKGRVVGSFTMYAGEPDFFTEEELSLLDELALDISFAIEIKESEMERMKLYDALQETETMFMQFLEHSPIYVFFKDDRMRSLRLSQNYEKLLGRPMRELLGKSTDELFPSEDAQKIIIDDQRLLSEGKQLEIEETIGEREYSTVKFPIRIGSRNFLAGFSIDITDRKRSEEKIREKDIQFRKLSSNVPDLIFQFTRRPDGSYCVPIASEGIRNIFGCSPEEVKDDFTPIARVIYPEDAERVTREIEYSAEHLTFFTCEFRVHIPGKEVQWIYSRSSPEKLEDGSITWYGFNTDITERKKSENILRVNEERLRLSLNAAQQGLFDLNVQTGEAIVNDGYAAMLGYDPATFIESNARWMERLHPDDVQRTSQIYRDYISGKLNEYRVEFRQRTVTGSYKWILSIGKITERTEDGKPLRLLGTHTDIDVMKRAEEKLLLQTTALESTANGIVITDLNGVIVWCNQAFTKITGYSWQEAIGAKPSLLKSGKQEAEFYEQMWSTIKAGKIWQGSVVNKRKDGTLYDDEMTITPVRDSKDAVTHYVAVKQDVTERNKTLRRIEEQAMLLDEAHDAIILQDNNFLIQFWNKGAERLFGWKSDEVAGKDIRSFVYQDKGDFKKENEQLMRDGVYSGEFVLRTKENNTIIVEVRMNVVKDDSGVPQSVLSIANDITDKKKIEMQLLRTQRMGSLGTLAGGIAHDLNNVMAPIMLAMELLKRNYVDASSQKILESVESSAKRGSEIVKQILAFARGVETQKVLLQPRHVIKEIVGIFQETFPRSITISTNIPTDTWTIHGDPTHFHQLIMNLGVNARDAMPDGGILTITSSNEVIDEHYVRMNIDAKVGRYVRFSVRDTGSGIPPAILDKIFEPFFTTKEVGKGTGLGLSTVYTIVKSHAGFITVQSTVGTGTTVNVFIPAADVSNDPKSEKQQKPDLRGNGELILVVDDEAAIREVTRKTLEAYGYAVLTATDGADAVARFAEHRGMIVLVLTDIMMPVMDGRQLIVMLKKMAPNVKIIASSGMIDRMKLKEEDEFTADEFLDKPYTAETLMTSIAKVMGSKLLNIF